MFFELRQFKMDPTIIQVKIDFVFSLKSNQIQSQGVSFYAPLLSEIFRIWKETILVTEPKIVKLLSDQILLEYDTHRDILNENFTYSFL